jgi:hypothetical protein
VLLPQFENPERLLSLLIPSGIAAIVCILAWASFVLAKHQQIGVRWLVLSWFLATCLPFATLLSAGFGIAYLIVGPWLIIAAVTSLVRDLDRMPKQVNILLGGPMAGLIALNTWISLVGFSGF